MNGWPWDLIASAREQRQNAEYVQREHEADQYAAFVRRLGVPDAQLGQMRDCMIHGIGMMIGGKHIPYDQFMRQGPDDTQPLASSPKMQ